MFLSKRAPLINVRPPGALIKEGSPQWLPSLLIIHFTDIIAVVTFCFYPNQYQGHTFDFS